MYVYDKANELAQAIHECDEYKALVAAGKILASDENAKKMVQDFLLKQIQLEYSQAMGGEPDKDKVEELNRLAEVLKNNKMAVDYLQAYRKWQTCAGDVLKIIQESMAEGMSILD